MNTMPANLPNEGAQEGAQSEPTMLPFEEEGATSEALAQTNDMSGPTMEPPVGGIASRGVGNTASAWDNNNKVTRLWTIDQTANAFVHVANTGWVKLSNKSEKGTTAMFMLAASAKQTQSNFNYRQEADKMIHEIYVW